MFSPRLRLMVAASVTVPTLSACGTLNDIGNEPALNSLLTEFEEEAVEAGFSADDVHYGTSEYYAISNIDESAAPEMAEQETLTDEPTLLEISADLDDADVADLVEINRLLSQQYDRLQEMGFNHVFSSVEADIDGTTIHTVPPETSLPDLEALAGIASNEVSSINFLQRNSLEITLAADTQFDTFMMLTGIRDGLQEALPAMESEQISVVSSDEQGYKPTILRTAADPAYLDQVRETFRYVHNKAPDLHIAGITYLPDQFTLHLETRDDTPDGQVDDISEWLRETLQNPSPEIIVDSG